MFVKADFKDLDEAGRASARSASISNTVGFLLDSPPAFLVAGIDIVGTARSVCFELRWTVVGFEGLEPESGVASMSFAPVDLCRGLRPRIERVPSSENSEESSSPLMMDSQGLHTRKEPDCPKWSPDINDVHLESKI